MNPEDLDELEQLWLRYHRALQRPGFPQRAVIASRRKKLETALVRLAPQLIVCAREYGGHGSIHLQAPYIAGPECEE